MTTLPTTTSDRPDLSAVPRPRRILADRSHLSDGHRSARPAVPAQASRAALPTASPDSSERADGRAVTWLFVTASGRRTQLVMSPRTWTGDSAA